MQKEEIVSEQTILSKEEPRLTSVRLSEEDWQFCKLHRLQFTTLLQERIAEIRAVESGAIVENVQEERRKKEVWMEKAETMRKILEKHGLIDTYLKELS